VSAGSAFGSFLAGIRILDLSQYIPGPMATLFLADMGAEVLKIEPPRGDEMRALGPRDAEGRPVFYRALNAGKTVRRMDLKDPSERATFLDLVRGADVVVEGFRPGVMARLEIDYDRLRAVNPAVVLCSISGYGAVSPYAQVAGHDANYLASMGMLHRNGQHGPMYFDPPVSDVAGSLFAGMAILGALHGRARTGTGCHVETALADTVMPLQVMQIADFGANGTVPGPGETYLNGGAAYYQVYGTADGRHVVLGAVEPKFWAVFCAAAGRPDWVARQSEPIPQHALRADVAALFASMTRAEAEERFRGGDCCLTPVRNLGEALQDPAIASRGLVRRDPDGALQALFPVITDGMPPDARPALRHADAAPASARTIARK
jgi:alpha-methylacyl-CoA racemase